MSTNRKKELLGIREEILKKSLDNFNVYKRFHKWETSIGGPNEIKAYIDFVEAFNESKLKEGGDDWTDLELEDTPNSIEEVMETELSCYCEDNEEELTEEEWDFILKG